MGVAPCVLLVVPVFSTLAGGLLALRFRHSLTTLIALGAGLLLGAAFLDLLPEAISIGSSSGVSPTNVLGLSLLSFLLFLGVQSALDHLSAGWDETATGGKTLGENRRRDADLP